MLTNYFMGYGWENWDIEVIFVNAGRLSRYYCQGWFVGIYI